MVQNMIPYSDQPFMSEALRYIYIAQFVRSDGPARAGVLTSDCRSYLSQIKKLLSEGDIKEVGWLKLGGYMTTPHGTQKAQTIIENIISNDKILLENELDKIPRRLLRYLQDIILSDELGLSDQGRRINIDRNIGQYDDHYNIRPSYWCLLSDKDVLNTRDHLFQLLSKLKLMVKAYSYVSTRGGETREFVYVPASELKSFLTDYLTKGRLSGYLWPEELEEMHSVFHILNRFNNTLPNVEELERIIPVRYRESVNEFIEECLSEKVITENPEPANPYLIIKDSIWYNTERKNRFQKPLLDYLLSEKPTLKKEEIKEPPPIQVTKEKKFETPIKKEETEQPIPSFEITFPPYDNGKTLVFGRGELDGKLAWGFEVGKPLSVESLITSDLTNINEGHVGFFMQIRGGKSTLAASIMLQAAFQGIPVVIIDPKPDYVSNLIPLSRGLSISPAFRDGAVTRFGKVKQDMRGFDLWQRTGFGYKKQDYELVFQVITFNKERKTLPGVIQFRAPLLALPSLEDEDFIQQCDSAATTLAMELISKADEKGYNTLISRAIRYFKQNNPNAEFLLFDDLVSAIQNLNDDLFGDREMKRVLQALRGYQTKTSAFFAGKPEEVTDIRTLISPKTLTIPITVLDVSQLTAVGKTAPQQNFVSQVCGQIYRFMQSNSGQRAVELLLILDEAQNYLPNPTDQYNYIRKLIQEGAALRVKVIVIGQVPQNIEMSARQQLKTLVLSHIPEGTVRYVTDSFSLPDIWSEKRQQTGGGISLIINENTANRGGALCNTFSSPQMVGLAQADQIKKAMDIV